MTNTILQVDASALTTGSVTRELTQYLSKQLAAKEGIAVVPRDLNATDLTLVTQAHIGAYYTAPDERSDEQKQLLTLSDALIAELKGARYLVFGAPMYNFSVPAAMKAWIDLVCRVGETFVYTENGPKGLLENVESAFVVVSTGGTPLGSAYDFTSGYMKQVCHFIGVNNVHIIDASGSKADTEATLAKAKADIDALVSA